MVLVPLCILVSAISLVLRFLRSEGEQREQIKWLAFAASILGLGFSSYIIPSVFVVEDPTGGAGPLWVNLLEDAVTLSFAGVPVAVGIAILRYRLYEIDTLINRTLVYGTLTATLIALYFGGIVLLQRLFVTLIGQQSTLAVVASTLLIAALFNPLRRRIQGFVDRSFYRRKYDARKTLEAFNSRLREETDLDALGEDLVEVVRETLQPAHASLWLRPDVGAREQGGGSREPRGWTATFSATSPPALIIARNAKFGVAPACVGPPEGGRSVTPRWCLPRSVPVPAWSWSTMVRRPTTGTRRCGCGRA